MSNWYQTETPFGRIAYAVRPDGSLYIHPHAADLEPRTDHITGETYSGLVSGDRGTLTINGREYGATFEFERNRYTSTDANGDPVDTYSVRTNVFGDGFTDSARRKLNEWLTAHHSELATGERRAFARWHSAATADYYARGELNEAAAKQEITAAELAAARTNLDGYRA